MLEHGSHVWFSIPIFKVLLRLFRFLLSGYIVWLFWETSSFELVFFSLVWLLQPRFHCRTYALVLLAFCKISAWCALFFSYRPIILHILLKTANSLQISILIVGNITRVHRKLKVNMITRTDYPVADYP